MIFFLLYHAQIPCSESETMNDTKICFCTWSKKKLFSKKLCCFSNQTKTPAQEPYLFYYRVPWEGNIMNLDSRQLHVASLISTLHASIAFSDIKNCNHSSFLGHPQFLLKWNLLLLETLRKNFLGEQWKLYFKELLLLQNCLDMVLSTFQARLAYQYFRASFEDQILLHGVTDQVLSYTTWVWKNITRKK